MATLPKKRGLTTNWARVVESITKEETCKDKVKGGKLAIVKKETTYSGGSMMPSEDVNISHIQPMQVELEYGDAFASLLTNQKTTIHFVHNKCPTRVALEDVLTNVVKLLQLKKKLQSFCKSKIKSLKSNHVVASSKLLGMKYNMDDKKTTLEEV
jgi:hypothetical protein